MTRYDVYIPLPRLHLVFFGKWCLRLVIWLHKHINSTVFISEKFSVKLNYPNIPEKDQEEHNDKSN